MSEEQGVLIELKRDINTIIRASQFHAQDGVSDHVMRYAHESTNRLAEQMLAKLDGFIKGVPDMDKPDPISEQNAFEFVEGGVVFPCIIEAAKQLSSAVKAKL